MGSSVDWTQVLVALIAGLPAIIGAVFSAIVLLRIRTPSGGSIGAVVERTHDLSAVDVAISTAVHKQVTNGAPLPEAQPEGG